MISFIIPARNESKYIANTIQIIITLMSNNYLYEIIVVDNASTDNTADIARQFGSVNVICCTSQVRISKARNVGVSSSSGDVLVFLDADILITDSWINGLLEFVNFSKIDCSIVSGCRVAIAKEPSMIELAWFDNIKTPANPSYINSGNLVTTKSVFNSINGFDESLATGEDVDFCTRAKVAGAKIEPNKMFFAHHEGYPKTIMQFFKREQWHGVGDVQSWGKFIASKVALFSWVMIFSLCAVFVLCIAQQQLMSLFVLGFFFVVNGWIVRRRFRVSSVGSYGFIFCLHVVYLLARCSSIFAKDVQRAR